MFTKPSVFKKGDVNGSLFKEYNERNENTFSIKDGITKITFSDAI
jgi:hypothetical protein